ncbi:MAG: hypothetical protein ACLQBK_05750 [Candidatus Sulfotelmatobacter sp.]
MTSGLMSLGSVLHGCGQNLCPAGNSREATLDVHRSLLAGGETDCDNAGCGDEIPQGFLLVIRKNDAFRTTFVPGFDHRILLTQTIKPLVHDFNLSPSINSLRPDLWHMGFQTGFDQTKALWGADFI